MQEIGRAGRDGKEAEALLYYNNSDLANNAKITDAMRQFCQIKTCRREYLCRNFGVELIVQQDHDCCDICDITCQCKICINNIKTSETATHSNASYTKIKDPPIVEDLVLQLFMYLSEERKIKPSIKVTQQAIYKLASSYDIYRNMSHLKQDFGFFPLHVLNNISFLINENIQIIT